MAGSQRYDSIGTSYAEHRRPDPRWAAQLHTTLGPPAPLLNVGAGTGNYEPQDRPVIALEPSQTMIDQRTSDAPVLRGTAESIPFADQTFEVATALLTVHHWTDQAAGLREPGRRINGAKSNAKRRTVVRCCVVV